MATGHYVASRALPGGGSALYRAREAERDQSYFLFGTTRAQLDVLRFPLGERTKAETRDLARRFGLSVADKQDSQDICFVPTGHYADVIARLKPGAAGPGDIVDLDGRVLGHHDGIIHFTVGQRRGLGFATGKPLYVLSIDPQNNRVIVGRDDALHRRTFETEGVNWVSIARPSVPLRATVKIRHKHDPAPAKVEQLDENRLRVTFDTPQRAITPGQAAVLYDGDRVLAGGWIRSGEL